MIDRLPVVHPRNCSTARFSLIVTAAGAICLVGNQTWAATLLPLTTWSSNSDGWLSPGEGGYTHLTTSNDQRGIAYGNDHVYLVNKAGGNNIRILDQDTGADLGGLDATGITGGTFQVDSIAVGGDGAIYVSNLSLQTTTSPYKVYKWTNEASTPSVVYSGDAGLGGARLGDDLAAIGSGSSTRLVAGYGNSPAPAGANGYAIIDPTAGTATAVGFAGSPPNSGDFRLGITFLDSSHVLGTQGGSLYRYSSFSGATGTLIDSPTIPDPAGATADRLMAVTSLGGKTILGMQSIGDSHVTVYDITNPQAPIHLASRNNTTAPVANGNATGNLAWGAITFNLDGSISQNLYAMSSNQGIQAFVFTLQAPVVDGDYNGNGVVDSADYVIWRKTEGTAASPAGSGADGSGDGNIGPEDYEHWRARFGNPNAGSGASLGTAIPEPSALVLALLAAMGSISWRRHR